MHYITSAPLFEAVDIVAPLLHLLSNVCLPSDTCEWLSYPSLTQHPPPRCAAVPAKNGGAQGRQLQPAHREAEPVRARGGGLLPQPGPLQPARLRRHRALRVHQDGECLMIRWLQLENRVCLNIDSV